MMRSHTKITIESYSVGSPVAPAIPVHHDQAAAHHRLHLIASSVPPNFEVSVRAGDVIHVLNALLQETRRADQAVARLESLAASAAQPMPSVN
jgi:hypothetical protein